MASVFPTKCRHCETKLVWTDKNTHLMCPNKQCFGVAFERLSRFFNSKAIKVDHLSTGRLAQLAKAGIDTPQKILTANEKQISALEGFGSTIAKKLIVNIKDAFKSTSLQAVMAASGIFQNENMGLAEERLEPIVKALGKNLITTGKIEAMTPKLLGIAGVGPETRKLFLASIQEFQVFFAEISALVTFDATQLASVKFAGKVFVFSDFRDTDLEALIKNNGGKVGSGISSKTTMLFSDSSTTNKARDYIALGKTPTPTAKAEEYLFSLLK